MVKFTEGKKKKKTNLCALLRFLTDHGKWETDCNESCSANWVSLDFSLRDCGQ